MSTIKLDGSFYPQFKEMNQGYDPRTFECAERTVSKLLSLPTTEGHPGILLGKVQSGKTRTFISVLALAFDNGYDIAVVLSKNSIALHSQTIKRLTSEFSPFTAAKRLAIHDIMALKAPFTKYETKQKVILVVKKQTDNLSRLIDRLGSDENFPGILGKRVLIIDDEADNASVGYSKASDRIEANKIATQINELRVKLPNCSFLQVTATPYSLYLQPTDVVVSNVSEFRPIRPRFTELVPVPEGYVGGEVYFGENARSDVDTVEKLIHETVSPRELELMEEFDGRSINRKDLLNSGGIVVYRKALVTFLVGGSIQRLNAVQSGQPIELQDFSFLVHTDTSKGSHQWQHDLTGELIDAFLAAVKVQDPAFKEMVREAYENLSASMCLASQSLPSLEAVRQDVESALEEEEVRIVKVNSDEAIVDLLDDNGQLKLTCPFNIFVGGQQLDRGVTIANMLGFYYGRRPNTLQQDTVLQHSRMFGFRLKDLAVTRFYTATAIRQAMFRMEEYDQALRSAIEADSTVQGGGGVRFIRKSTDGSVIPCSPNKILASKTQTLKPRKRMVPFGFQTGYRTGANGIETTINGLHAKLESLCGFDTPVPTLVPLAEAIDLMDRVESTLIFDENDPNVQAFDWDAAKSALRYLSQLHTDDSQRGKVWLWAVRGREMPRFAGPGSHSIFIETPDSKTETKIATEFAIDHPILFMLGQKGIEKPHGWRDAEFYWPVLRAQKNTPVSIFATKVAE